MLIRQETASDHEMVYDLVRRAFASAQHSDGSEQDLVAALRNGDAFIPKLSLIAVKEQKTVGHILFTKAMVGEDTVLALAPLSVLPGFQRQGIGTLLIEEGHRIARALGYGYSLVLGSPDYYARFGYLPAQQFGITAPWGIDPDYFMAAKLLEDAKSICGKVCYAKEFGLSC